MKRSLHFLLNLFLIFIYFAVEAAAGPVKAGVFFDFDSNGVTTYKSFCRDSDGYLWIATEQGLLRFDGNSYDIYRHNSQKEGSLSDNRIIDLLCDSKGRVWVATANGLNLYDRSTDSFRLIKIPMQDFNGYIIDVAEQADGTIIFMFSGQGLYVIDDSNKDQPTAVCYMSHLNNHKEYNSIVCAADGKFYVGDHFGYVHAILPNGEQKSVKVGDSYVREMALESDGNLIVNILNEIYRVNTSTLNVSKLRLPESLNISILSDGAINGDVYIGTTGNGIWYVKAGDTDVKKCSELYSPFINIDATKISAIHGGDNGSLWIACDYRGILLIPSKDIPFVYRRVENYFKNFIGGINSLCAFDDAIMVAIEDNLIGMLSADGKLLKSFKLPCKGAATSMVSEPGGRVLVGISNSGVWELSVSTGSWNKLIDIPGDYPSIYVNTDGGDDVFVAIHGIGVMRYNRSDGNRKWFEIDPDGNCLTNPYVNQMVRTDDDKIWLGQYGGIACYDLKSDKFLQINQEPFRQGSTYALVPLKDGKILAGTSHGVIEFHPVKGIINKYTTQDGLTDNDVRTIVIDKQGGRWIGTMRGLSYQDASTGAIRSYYGSYGLVENSFRNSVLSPSDGKIYLGSDLGITCFDPVSVPSSVFNSGVKISAIFLNGERVAPNTKSGTRLVIEGNPMMPDVINLPYSDNAVSLRLSTMDFRDSSNMVYLWRVKDIGDEWLETLPGENMIYLPYLEPGTHYLQLRGEENGELSPMVEIKIKVSPPWYLSTWAKCLYVLVFAVLLMLGWLVMQKKKEEKINDAKIKYFIDVSHDIRSPITLILSPLESLLKRPFDEDVRKQLKMMQRNGQRILSLVNQMLDIRKLDKGKMRLSCRKTDLSRFVKELVEMFKPQALENGLTLDYEMKSEISEIWIDRDNVDKILVNLISNAIKYTPKGGTVKVVVEEVDDEKLGRAAQISVVDTGIGLDSKFESKIFERFYRGRENHVPGTQGFGIGLDLCNRLVELHHGLISGKNRIDGVKGSVFTVRLALDSSFYSPDELNDKAGEVRNPENEVERHIVDRIETADSEEVQSVRKKGKKIYTVLVVDDHKELRQYLCEQLSSQYKVLSANDGEEALKIIVDKTPDIIVSDVIMPNIDGLELLRRVKSNSSTNHIPVILLSSKNELSDRMAGWNKGADGYLGKPFIYDELEMLIDTLIENRLRVKGQFTGVREMEEKISTPEVKGNDEKLMDRIIKVIEANIDDSDFNVEKLAKEAGLSRVHLHRKMKEKMGLNPSDFIRNIRLRRACELLQKPDIEITQIAYLVGYTSQPHFSTAFKKFTGYTPSEYRARLQSDTLQSDSLPDESVK